METNLARLSNEWSGMTPRGTHFTERFVTTEGLPQAKATRDALMSASLEIFEVQREFRGIAFVSGMDNDGERAVGVTLQPKSAKASKPRASLSYPSLRRKRRDATSVPLPKLPLDTEDLPPSPPPSPPRGAAVKRINRSKVSRRRQQELVNQFVETLEAEEEELSLPPTGRRQRGGGSAQTEATEGDDFGLQSLDAHLIDVTKATEHIQERIGHFEALEAQQRRWWSPAVVNFSSHVGGTESRSEEPEQDARPSDAAHWKALASSFTKSTMATAYSLRIVEKVLNSFPKEDDTTNVFMSEYHPHRQLISELGFASAAITSSLRNLLNLAVSAGADPRFAPWSTRYLPKTSQAPEEEIEAPLSDRWDPTMELPSHRERTARVQLASIEERLAEARGKSSSLRSKTRTEQVLERMRAKRAEAEAREKKAAAEARNNISTSTSAVARPARVEESATLSA